MIWVERGNGIEEPPLELPGERLLPGETDQGQMIWVEKVNDIGEPSLEVPAERLLPGESDP